MSMKIFCAASVAALSVSFGGVNAAPAGLEFVERYQSNLEGGTEISAFDPASERVFVTNGATGDVDIIDMSMPADPLLVGSLNVDGEPTHVAVSNGILAVSVNKGDGAERGEAQFYNAATGTFIESFKVGFLPDMISFAEDGRFALTANEGEPVDDFDPRGSVSVIDLRPGNRQNRACEVDFSSVQANDLDASVRLFPGKTPEFDLEPEYVVAPKNGNSAYAILQEANAIAEIDFRRCSLKNIFGLGFKDHSLAGNALDPSDRDGAINIATHPVFGIYQPDGAAAFNDQGQTFIVTANEGDDRGENEDIGDLELDPSAFPNAAELQDDAVLGRLGASTIDGDIDGDGDFDQLYVYGGRSFSIYRSDGEQVFDSGDDLEKITAAAFPENFNASDDDNSFENRSDNKGPEPEGVAIGEIAGQRLAFIGLERIGGVMVYDITDPYAPSFCSYTNTRDFSVEEIAFDTDLAPEGLVFVPANESPTAQDLLFVSYEVSGTVAAFTVNGGVCG